MHGNDIIIQDNGVWALYQISCHEGSYKQVWKMSFQADARSHVTSSNYHQNKTFLSVAIHLQVEIISHVCWQ